MKLSKMSQEELELLSYTQIAALYLVENKKTMTTAELFKEVCNLLKLDESEYHDKIADFFQSLTTSKDFILLNDGNWDLRKNHKVKVEIDEIYEEKDDEPIEEEEEELIDEPEEDPIDDFDLDLDDDLSDDDDDLSDLTIVTEDEENEE